MNLCSTGPKYNRDIYIRYNVVIRWSNYFVIQCFNAVTAKGILASTLKVEYLKKYGKNVLFTTKILIFQFVTDITLFFLVSIYPLLSMQWVKVKLIKADMHFLLVHFIHQFKEHGCFCTAMFTNWRSKQNDNGYELQQLL